MESRGAGDQQNSLATWVRLYSGETSHDEDHSGFGTNLTTTKLTGWQAHAVRGFVSGTLLKKMRLKIAASDSSDGAVGLHQSDSTRRHRG